MNAMDGVPVKLRRKLWPVYAAEAFASLGSSLLSVSIFFWTQRYLGWDLRQNFLLAVGQGTVYVFGALLAERVAGKFGRRISLVGIYLLLIVFALCAAAARSPAVLVVFLLCYSCAAAANWPMLESLVTSGAGVHAISKRVSVYNLVWSCANSVTMAISGTLIVAGRAGIFFASAAAALVCAGLLMLQLRGGGGRDVNGDAPAVHAEPEPELLASRKLAMWLARIALPATYVVIFSMMAMMPSLPVMQELSTQERTLVSSVWMAARSLTFLALGFTVWWHTRPRLLLISAAVMLIAFLGVTIPPSAIAPASLMVDLGSMLLWQIVLGCAMGIIYSGSLYFGMVLSEGSTEHGGYHEALIGLGCVLGPGAGAVVQSFGSAASSAGRTPWMAIGAVGLVVAATVVAAGVATIRIGRAKSNLRASQGV
jgi:MFS family permease